MDMRNKFKNIIDYKKYIIYLFFIILSILYLYMFNKYDFVRNKISNNKVEDGTLISKIVSNSLNRIVDFNAYVPEIDFPKEILKVSNNDISKEKKEPIIYIYNTHDTEKYSLPFSTDYSITPNVKIASYILKDHLNNYGIESTVEKKEIKDYLNKHKVDYSYSYAASREYMLEEIKKHDYKILIDLHRDSASHKQTLYEKDGKKYAKVMFVLGQDYETYKNNQSFLKNLNDRIDKDYKGLSRGIYIRKNSRFNQDLSSRAILLELGGVDNTLEEINNTLDVFARILSEYINEELYGRS